MLVSLVVTAVCLLAIGFYVNLGTAAGWFIGTLFIVLLVVFMFIQNLVYQIMVSRSTASAQNIWGILLFSSCSVLERNLVIVIRSITNFLYRFVPFILLMSYRRWTLCLPVSFIAVAFVPVPGLTTPADL